jgi:hypothetical protein
MSVGVGSNVAIGVLVGSGVGVLTALLFPCGLPGVTTAGKSVLVGNGVLVGCMAIAVAVAVGEIVTVACTAAGNGVFVGISVLSGCAVNVGDMTGVLVMVIVGVAVGTVAVGVVVSVAVARISVAVGSTAVDIITGIPSVPLGSREGVMSAVASAMVMGVADT